jgi:hypothetical protein
LEYLLTGQNQPFKPDVAVHRTARCPVKNGVKMVLVDVEAAGKPFQGDRFPQVFLDESDNP